MDNSLNIVIGAGKLGSSVAKSLYEKGENVTVIDINKSSIENLEGYGGFFECADATDFDVLKQNLEKKPKSVTIATCDDDTNIYISNVCYSIFGVENIFVRLTDSRKAKLCKYGKVKCICPFDLSMNSFEEYYKGI